ncbi:hypothetical protein [Sphingobacterium populi]|uniref:hypothetical protein n=1 Tax=Sphingobacterium sp. CFCC 11742 TaxID=1775560 RepID=UPI00082FB310|nr:hypothetical protein [Sphingobacterium sp. CFCC 11742]
MFKNTIKKAFQKDLIENIWKIEVNGYGDEIAVETRDSKTTNPTHQILRFADGAELMRYATGEKDWTMEGIQKDFLILKKVGEQTPVKEGIQVIQISTQKPVWISYEYVLIDVLEDYLHIRPRNLTTGGEQFVDISTGEVCPVNQTILQNIQKIVFPSLYPMTIHQIFSLLIIYHEIFGSANYQKLIYGVITRNRLTDMIFI